jgi:hypothetical protein
MVCLVMAKVAACPKLNGQHSKSGAPRRRFYSFSGGALGAAFAFPTLRCAAPALVPGFLNRFLYSSFPSSRGRAQRPSLDRS